MIFIENSDGVYHSYSTEGRGLLKKIVAAV